MLVSSWMLQRIVLLVLLIALYVIRLQNALDAKQDLDMMLLQKLARHALLLIVMLAQMKLQLVVVVALAILG
jgi:hypothetical protein